MHTLSDKELMRKMQKSESAFEIIFDRHWSRLYTYAFNVLKDQSVCEDLVQEVFIDLWQKRKEKEIENLSAFLLQAIKFKIFNHIRSLKVVHGYLDRISKLEITQASFEETLLAQEDEKLIRAMVEDLPSRCKEIFLLSRFEQLSNQEIATQLGISIQTVKNQISKALSHLRKKNVHALTASITLFILLWNGLFNFF